MITSSEQSLKNSLRSHFKKTRSDFAKSSRFSEHQSILNQNLISCLEHFQLKKWAGYVALPDEPSIDEAMQKTKGQIEWLLPVVSGQDLKFYIPSGPLKKARFGIQEPDPDISTPIDLKEISGVILPGLSFDRKGCRMGYGLGFYDRALTDYEGLKVGVTFEIQIYQQDLPQEKHDVLVDVLVTDQGIFDISERNRIYG